MSARAMARAIGLHSPGRSTGRRVFVSPTKGVVFMAASLPHLDSGKTFELWVIPAKGNPVPAGVPPRNVVVIGSSTGGPTALIDIFARMPARAPTALLVAQHMPDKFTRTFAERLDRKGAMRVTEAQDMDVVSASTGTI